MSPKKKKEETKPKPIDLKLTLENFGPLRKAEIDLKPMTIFIGPNNSGKSYAATMFYCLFQSVKHAELLPGPGQGRSFSNIEADEQAIRRAFKKLAKLYRNEAPKELPVQTAAGLARVFDKPLSAELTQEVYRCWPPDRCPLGRRDKQGFRLDVHSEPLLFSFEEHSRVLKTKPPQKPVNLKMVPFLRFPTNLPDQAHHSWEALAGMYWDLAEYASTILFSRFDRAAYYVPASRSGIIKHLRLVTDRALERLEWRDGAQPSMHLPGVDLDFMRHLLNLPQAPGPLDGLLLKTEEELIAGDIVLRWADPNLPPDFWYRFEGGQIGLEFASSAVCDLAPLIVFRRILLRQGDLLIIDEPEAHLHPGAIRILAKYLVRLVQERVNLIITTHSDYLLEQLNNFILLSKVDPKRRKEKYQDYEVDDFLKPEEVGAYVFNYDEKEEGYVTQELVIDEEEGLIEEEFNKVNESLYDELASLRRDVAKQSKK